MCVRERERERETERETHTDRDTDRQTDRQTEPDIDGLPTDRQTPVVADAGVDVVEKIVGTRLSHAGGGVTGALVENGAVVAVRVLTYRLARALRSAAEALTENCNRGGDVLSASAFEKGVTRLEETL